MTSREPVTLETQLMRALGGKGASSAARVQRQAVNAWYDQMATQRGLMNAQCNSLQNAYAPQPDTLETWFERLERRVNSLLDAGDFMGELEYARWSDELERWRSLTP